MIGRGLFVLTILSNCVLSLPVTSSQLENEDVKVLKCIVEALADVLSRPHPVPVSQECLVTLKTDDRLVTVLRHHNFLKELQEIAVQGGKERNQLQQDSGIPDLPTQAHQTPDDAADQSMLEALGGLGERSILSQKSRTGNVDEEKEKDESPRDGESEEDNDSTEDMQEKREKDESTGSHVSESVDEWSEGKAGKREEEEEEYEEMRANSEGENMTKDKKAAGSDEKRDVPGNKSKEKKFHEEVEEETDKRSLLSSSEEEDEEEKEMKRGSKEHLKQWTKRGKSLQLKKKAGGKQVQEVPHHSKEVTEEEEEEEEEDEEKKKSDTQRSPEEKELQMIAEKTPEERRVLEEEGSASRKSEEPEIEGLAAIESELENIAQKLHELRRG